MEQSTQQMIDQHRELQSEAYHLGLAIMKRLLKEGQQGNIEIVSNERHGDRFNTMEEAELFANINYWGTETYLIRRIKEGK